MMSEEAINDRIATLKKIEESDMYNGDFESAARINSAIRTLEWVLKGDA